MRGRRCLSGREAFGYKEVASRLSVSARTVGSHLEHAYTKIGVSTRGAAAMFAMRHGLVAPADDEA